MKARANSSVPNSPQPSDLTDPSSRDSPVSSVNSDSCSLGGIASESELLHMASPADLLCGPVPSCLPSPQLHPDPVLQSDLMHFEQKSPTTEGSETGLSAGDTSSGPEQQHTEDTDIPPQPPSKTASSPRRVSRSKFKLAANFSFTTGVWESAGKAASSVTVYTGITLTESWLNTTIPSAPNGTGSALLVSLILVVPLWLLSTLFCFFANFLQICYSCWIMIPFKTFQTEHEVQCYVELVVTVISLLVL